MVPTVFHSVPATRPWYTLSRHSWISRLGTHVHSLTTYRPLSSTCIGPSLSFSELMGELTGSCEACGNNKIQFSPWEGGWKRGKIEINAAWIHSFLSFSLVAVRTLNIERERERTSFLTRYEPTSSSTYGSTTYLPYLQRWSGARGPKIMSFIDHLRWCAHVLCSELPRVCQC